MTPEIGGRPIGPGPSGPGPIGPLPTGPGPTGPAPTGPGPTGPGPIRPLPTGPGPVGCADAALDTAMLVANTMAHTKQLSLRMIRILSSLCGSFTRAFRGRRTCVRQACCCRGYELWPARDRICAF